MVLGCTMSAGGLPVIVAPIVDGSVCHVVGELAAGADRGSDKPQCTRSMPGQVNAAQVTAIAQLHREQPECWVLMTTHVDSSNVERVYQTHLSPIYSNPSPCTAE